MNIKEKKIKSQHILYDQDIINDIDQSWFSADTLQQQGCTTKSEKGRGTTWFFTKNGLELVLRHYLRGGLAAGISNDRYLWYGLAKTRAWLEWHLLAKMQQLDLPAPRPFAAHVNHLGLSYTADIVTFEIKNVSTLTKLLSQHGIDNQTWHNIGICISQFHNNGIYHADLNASNILIRNDGEVFVTDFDKGKVLPARKSWQTENINRLKRSLLKFQASTENFHFTGADWDTLQTGYTQGLR